MIEGKSFFAVGVLVSALVFVGSPLLASEGVISPGEKHELRHDRREIRRDRRGNPRRPQRGSSAIGKSFEAIAAS